MVLSAIANESKHLPLEPKSSLLTVRSKKSAATIFPLDASAPKDFPW